MTVLSKEQVLSAFKNRKSCRHYDAARKISAEDFQFILELGRLSPSSVGSEPWQFVVVQNPEIRQAIKPFMLESLKRRGVTELDAVEKSLARYQAFQADHIKILDDSRALFDWCCRQTYIALANMMTGAAMAGIDSCPVEGFNYADMERVLSGQFGLFDAAEWGVSVAATFGYRVQEIATKARRSLEETVIWA